MLFANLWAQHGKNQHDDNDKSDNSSTLTETATACKTSVTKTIRYAIIFLILGKIIKFQIVIEIIGVKILNYCDRSDQNKDRTRGTKLQ